MSKSNRKRKLEATENQATEDRTSHTKAEIVESSSNNSNTFTDKQLHKLTPIQVKYLFEHKVPSCLVDISVDQVVTLGQLIHIKYSYQPNHLQQTIANNPSFREFTQHIEQLLVDLFNSGVDRQKIILSKLKQPLILSHLKHDGYQVNLRFSLFGQCWSVCSGVITSDDDEKQKIPVDINFVIESKFTPHTILASNITTTTTTTTSTTTTTTSLSTSKNNNHTNKYISFRLGQREVCNIFAPLHTIFRDNQDHYVYVYSDLFERMLKQTHPDFLLEHEDNLEINIPWFTDDYQCTHIYQVQENNSLQELKINHNNNNNAPIVNYECAPTGMAIHSITGDIFIAIRNKGKVHVYDSSKRFKYEFSLHLPYVTDLAINYITNEIWLTYGQTVVVCDLQGTKILRNARKRGKFKSPKSIAIDAIASLVFLIDTRAYGVQVLDTEGNHLFYFGHKNQDKFKPRDFTINTQARRVYVLQESYLDIFDYEGNRVAQVDLGRRERCVAYDHTRDCIITAVDQQVSIYSAAGEKRIP